MKINSVSASPNFGSTVRYIHNERYGRNLLKNEPFVAFIDKLANNGKSSTAIFIPDESNIWRFDRFASLGGIKDRETGNWISWKDLWRVGRLNNHVDCLEVDQRIQGKIIRFISIKENNIDYQALNGLDHGYLNLCVTDEIDGKIHLAHGSLRMDQDADRAAFEYLAAESVLPDNPVDVDPRLNKYLAPKPESRVTLMYEDTRKDLYKDEKFVSFMEWLDALSTNGKGKNFIVRPKRKYDGDNLNYIDIITAYKTTGFVDSSKMRVMQIFDDILWKGQQFDSQKIEEHILEGCYGDVSPYDDVIKPFNVCV